MTVNRPANPLALAVLALLFERPMHPYEMAATLKERGKERSIKLRYGSLYTVIDALVQKEFVRSLETTRAGRRPERTVMEITPAGERLLKSRMTELLSTPSHEYPQFVAALALMPVLPVEAALPLLNARLDRLSSEIERIVAEISNENAPPRLFLIEEEYRLALLRAEWDFLQGLVSEVSDGSLEGTDLWRRFHSDRA